MEAKNGHACQIKEYPFKYPHIRLYFSQGSVMIVILIAEIRCDQMKQTLVFVKQVAHLLQIILLSREIYVLFIELNEKWKKA